MTVRHATRYACSICLVLRLRNNNDNNNNNNISSALKRVEFMPKKIPLKLGYQIQDKIALETNH